MASDLEMLIGKFEKMRFLMPVADEKQNTKNVRRLVEYRLKKDVKYIISRLLYVYLYCGIPLTVVVVLFTGYTPLVVIATCYLTAVFWDKLWDERHEKHLEKELQKSLSFQAFEYEDWKLIVNPLLDEVMCQYPHPLSAPGLCVAVYDNERDLFPCTWAESDDAKKYLETAHEEGRRIRQAEDD